MKKLIFAGFLFVQFLQAEDLPILRFNDRVTWKNIFDAGFRPKHFLGLEYSKCIIPSQSFWVEFKGRETQFKVDEGRLSFSFYHDDFLSMLWHQGAEAIPLEEGRRRANLFREVFDGYITQEMTLPRLIDPSGLVDAGNDENNVKAQVGEYLIWYGFDNSMRKEKPIIPHFYITWNFRDMPEHKSKLRGDVVRPPKGYEWYSLDPKVNTPDPGSTPEPLPESEIKVPDEKPQDLPKVEAPSIQPENSKTIKDESRLGWWIGLVCLLFAVAVAAFRKYRSGKSKPK